MMKKAKKLLNDPKLVVPQSIDGVVCAYLGKVKKLSSGYALVKAGLPEPKVGLLVGGGSGHEPVVAGDIGDNLAPAPLDRIGHRRGIAGDFFVIKIAGAVAVQADLDQVYRVTSKARDNTRSLGVAVSAGSIPETREA